MGPKCKIEIDIDCKLASGNKMKTVNKKSEWNGGGAGFSQMAISVTRSLYFTNI